MDDLISRQAAIDALEKEQSLVERPITETRWFDLGLRKARDILCELPSVQPERKTGKWIQKSKPMEPNTVWWYECSECGDKPPRDRYGNPDYLSNFCPNCGADMRGEKDGN